VVAGTEMARASSADDILSSSRSFTVNTPAAKHHPIASPNTARTSKPTTPDGAARQSPPRTPSSGLSTPTRSGAQSPAVGNTG